MRIRPVCAQECDLQGNPGADRKHCGLAALCPGSGWEPGSPPSLAVVPELPAGGSGDLSRQPDGFWSVGHGGWAGFHFSQVGFCLHTQPVLIFLQIKPVCLVAGGGEGLSSGAFVTITENVCIASNPPPFCGSRSPAGAVLQWLSLEWPPFGHPVPKGPLLPESDLHGQKAWGHPLLSCRAEAPR